MQLGLNLGSGFDYKISDNIIKWINIDNSRYFKADLYINLDNKKLKLPFNDNSVDIIISQHILEHIKQIIQLINELYRMLKKGGQIIIIVPQGLGQDCDPTHVRRFNKLSWRYFCDYPLSECYGIKTHFKIIQNEFQDNQDGGQLNVILEK